MDYSTTQDLQWFKATLSSTSTSCVEVAETGSVVLVRDSKFLRNPLSRNRGDEQPMIRVPAERWLDFLDLVMSGGTTNGADLPAIDHDTDGAVTLEHAAVTLTYTAAEWHAFCDGITKGEFDILAAAA